MGRNWRHVKTLTRKNFINWRRTWIGSFLELVIPVLIMGSLVLYKINEQPETVPEENQLHYASAQYPVTQQVGINFYPIKNQPADLLDFLDFANITRDNPTEDFYQRHPEFFYPQHCYEYTPKRNPLDPDEPQFPSKSQNITHIAYIKNNNRIEIEFLNQLKLILKQQHEYAPDMFHNFTLIEFDNPDLLNLYVEHPNYGLNQDLEFVTNSSLVYRPPICFGFEIKKLSDSRYELHMHYNDQSHTDEEGAGIPRQLYPSWDPIKNSPDLVSFKKYMNNGYSQFQNWVANVILREVTDLEEASISMVTVPNKSAAYDYDEFMFNVLDRFLPLATLLSFFTPTFRLTYRMVSEKETRVRESMQMMGLTQAAYWISWFIYYQFFNLIISGTCTFILSKYMLKFTDWTILFIYFSSFGMAQFGFILFCQGFWQRARHAAIFTVVLFVSTASTSILVTPRDVPREQKMYASLIPTAVVFNLSKPLAGYESVGIGLDFETAQNLEFHNYIFMDGVKMLLLDFLIYSVLGIYIDNVMPRYTGTQRHWFYPCDWLTPTYWDCFNLCRRGNSKTVIEMRQEYQENTFKARKGAFSSKKLIFEDEDAQLDYDFETKYIQKENFEAPDIAQINLEKQNRYLKIHDLRKTFNNGFQAVNGINVRMYEGQIFALLGHNGAGKTTMISMLTGMLRPTTGFATVFGYDVFQYDLDDVRRFMGVCPQHDILFDLLTPWEHLSIFQDFKGSEKTGSQKRAEIEKLLKDVGIWDMRNTKAKNLSGGSKRKLSVAIALCGDSKFVMLDEPTSGMDLQARRSLWNMLRAYRNNRIIILTTHYMDEADVLGDRIGIMAQGKLVCLGASLFLKKRYGVGYNLTMEKTSQFANSSIKPYLQKNLGTDIRMLGEIAREITFQIPVEYSPKFKNFFAQFDVKSKALGVASYGISITTLEEVFLAVGDGRDIGEHALEKSNVRKKILAAQGFNDEDDEEERLSLMGEKEMTKVEMKNRKRQKKLEDYTIADQLRLCACCLHVLALCIKRCTIMFRGWRSLLFEIIAPVMFVAAGFGIIKLTFLYESPDRIISTKILPLPQEILVNTEPVLQTAFDGSKIRNNTKEVIDFLPASYTLLTDFDFEVTYRNYTEDMRTNYVNQVLGNDDPDFDLFQQFDADHFAERKDSPYRFGSYLIYQANNITKNYKVVNYVNTTSQDVAIAYPQFMYEAILRSATGRDHFQFKLVTNPFPILQKYKDQEKETSVISLLFVISVGLSLLPGLIVGGIMYEREKNLKHMQIISGMNLCSYWIVNLLFDIIKMEVPMILCCVLLQLFELTEYYSATFVFLAYPIGVVPFTHALSFLFQTEWAAQFFTVGLNLVVMIFGPLTVFIFMFNSTTQDDVYFGYDINYWLRVIPSYNVSKTLLFCGTKSILERRAADPLVNYPQDLDMERWSMQNQTGDLYALVAHSAVGVVLIIFFEAIIYRNCWARCFFCFFQCCYRATSRQIEDAFGEAPADRPDTEVKDQDVHEEEKRVAKTRPNDMPVRVASLKKVFKTGFCNNLTAVNNVSFGLETGECFALLGVNGAGKTTVFKSLTNDIVPTNGRVSIGGWDVQRWFGFARKRIGYCPQHNTIFEQMTVIENLYLFARIKGVKWMVRKSLINRTIDQMNLTQHKYKEAGTLSGGNKRKLQVAIAIIGNPPIMLLDEPSSGMDPEARRFMWQVVAGFTQKRKQCAVILTTHSMEEAEALSTKMGIMVKGGIFKCFGSVQHIKNKFGTGYELEIKFKRPAASEIQQIMQEFELPTEYAKMSIPHFKEFLSDKQFPEWLTEEITTGGLGDELLREAKSNKQGLVRILHLIEWINIMQNCMKIVKELARQFGTVEILNHHNSSFKFRVLRHNKSIGFLFGLIEDKKDEFAISEYSASQTTLEQIFQMFAHMSYDDDNVHLVFKYNEEYENDLEIHKSTTIQSLYNKPQEVPIPGDNQEDPEVQADSVQEVEMQDMGGQNHDADVVLDTMNDRSAFTSGATHNLINNYNTAAIQLKEVDKDDDEPVIVEPIVLKPHAEEILIVEEQPSVVESNEEVVENFDKIMARQDSFVPEKVQEEVTPMPLGEADVSIDDVMSSEIQQQAYDSQFIANKIAGISAIMNDKSYGKNISKKRAESRSDSRGSYTGNPQSQKAASMSGTSGNLSQMQQQPQPIEPVAQNQAPSAHIDVPEEEDEELKQQQQPERDIYEIPDDDEPEENQQPAEHFVMPPDSSDDEDDKFQTVDARKATPNRRDDPDGAFAAAEAAMEESKHDQTSQMDKDDEQLDTEPIEAPAPKMPLVYQKVGRYQLS